MSLRLLFVVPLLAVLFCATGCSTSDTLTGNADPATQQPSTHESDGPLPQSEIHGGTVLKTWQVTPAGTSPYKMPDGTYIVVDAKKPLPAPVKKDIVQKARGVSKVGGASNSGNLASANARGAFIQQVEQSTGKPDLAFVVSGFSAVSVSDPTVKQYWFAIDASGTGQHFDTEAQAIAYAKSTWPNSELIVAGQ